MKNPSDSRVRYLRLALQEAVKAGDEKAVKRLTKRIVSLLHPERKSA